MKVGDLVRLCNNRLGVIMAYYKEYDNKPSGFPWYVWTNGKIEYYQTKHLEFL
jgi:hypothetical protein|tara:strand:- start:465 stop:623 length:159 start_codon:yes stop_codon:yes gene_type:complete